MRRVLVLQVFFGRLAHERPKNAVELRVTSETSAPGCRRNISAAGEDELHEALETELVAVVDERDTHLRAKRFPEFAGANPETLGQGASTHAGVIAQALERLGDEPSVTALAGAGGRLHGGLGETSFQQGSGFGRKANRQLAGGVLVGLGVRTGRPGEVKGVAICLR